MLGKLWTLLKTAGLAYSDDNCLSRGAAIAYYTVFSLAPVLLIVIAVAGLVFGEQAAQGAVVSQINGLMGQQGAEAVQSMLQGAARRGTGILATVIGVVTLLVAASGVFGEMQAALNAIWRATPPAGTFWRLLRARLISLGLVVTLGFLLMVSLVASAALQAVGGWLSDAFPGVHAALWAASLVTSFVLATALFGAIYKILPDTRIAWRDVIVGAAVTALLFAIGKNLISLYIGSSSIATTYGAAGALAVIFVWIYYSSQIFLFGAEFTRAFATTHGSRQRDAMPLASGHDAEIEGLKSRLGTPRSRAAR